MRLRRVADWVVGHAKQLRSFVFRGAAERELAEELADHLERETEQNLRRGMAPAEARRAALLAFGGVERYAEQVREVRWTRWVDDLARDIRYSFRSLSRSRAFAVTVVLTLALGVGANAALYSLINALVFRMPTGVPESDRLVRVHGSERWRAHSHADMRDLQRGGGGAIDLAGYVETSVSLRSRGEAVRVGAQLVTANYFDVLGVQPLLGRWFTGEEDAVPARDAVIVLSHGLWKSRFAEDRAAVGADVVINGHPFRVVGVAPPGFRGLSIEDGADVWVPFMAQPWAMPRPYDVLGSRTAASVSVVGRLGADVSVSRAEAALAVAAGRLPDAERFAPVTPIVIPLRGWIEPDSLGGGVAIFGFAGILTGLVLLICCANVAGLQFARALGRGREVAVRAALGAGRSRLVRMLVTESVLLALAAGAAGVLVAWALARWLQVRFASSELGDGPFDALLVAPDANTLLFTFILAVAAGMMFGLMPALRAARPGLTPMMKGALPGGGSPTRLRSVLVCAQVAASLVLLVAAGLFLDRLHRIGDTEFGFDPDRLAAFSVDLHAHGYDEAARDGFFEQVRHRLARIPGVQEVAAPTAVPLGSGAALLGIERAGDARDGEAGSAGEDAVEAGRVPAVAVGVAGNFFSTLSVNAVRGRTLLEEDLRAAEKRVVISEPLARRLWGGADPIGRSLTLGTDVVVVGNDTTRVPGRAVVVGTVRPLALTHIADPSPLQVYLPANRHMQFAEQGVVVRTSGAAAGVLSAIRSEMQRIDGALPIFELRSLAADVERQFRVQRTLTRLVAAFGAVALLLALVGLYGIIAAGVAARTADIGVRVALGAGPREVTAMFVGGGVRVAGYGILVGALLALGTGRLISSIVWGVRPYEPVVIVATALLLTMAAALASWVPARRAARVDPMRVLREE